MTRIFPDARDYKTVNHAITQQERATIEKELGLALLPGQRDQFQYFEMTNAGGKVIGTVIAASQKGEFGAIEFVFGIDTTGVINNIYVQRSRERDTQFKERAFLDLFIGKNSRTVTSAYNGPVTTGTRAIIQGLQKELVTLALVSGKAK